MKKILSVMLAIMMLFGAMSINASAAGEDKLNEWRNNSIVEINDVVYGNGMNDLGESYGYVKSNYVVLCFNFGTGTSYKTLAVYDSQNDKFVYEKVSGEYIMFPGADNNSLAVGSSVILPLVTAPEGKQCTAWYCVETNSYEVTGKPWTIPAITGGVVYTFVAEIIPAEEEADTLTTILGILTKVFGTILGILFLDGSSAAGVALVEKLLGGLL